MNHKSINIIKVITLIFSFAFLLNMHDAKAQDSSETSNAKIAISFSEKDSTRQATAKLTNSDTAVKGVDIHFYIKKSFGLLPIEGDNVTTDENGEASVDFPTDVPGDASGNLIVIARIEDDDNLGNVEATKTINWGVPAKAEQAVATRELWSSGNNAPWPLVITVTGMVCIVWGIIFYICYQLIVIKRAGKYEAKSG